MQFTKADTMSKQILIIDDDEEILKVLETVLEYNEFNVTALSEIDNLFAAIEAYQPDLILTDFLLSGINGGEICQKVKSNKETCHIPVILISGYPELAVSFGKFGFDAFINKPFNIGDLIETIDHLLEK